MQSALISINVVFSQAETLLFSMVGLTMAGSICFIDQPTPNTLYHFTFPAVAKHDGPTRFLKFLEKEAVSY